MYEPRTHKGIFGLAVGWVVAAVVLFGSIGVGLWAFGVFTAPIKGKGDAIKIRESAVNRIQKQEMFEQLSADIDGYVAKIAAAERAVAAADGLDQGLRQTELIGLRQVCIDTVQQYNAESRKYTSRDFKSAGLPFNREAGECS